MKYCLDCGRQLTKRTHLSRGNFCGQKCAANFGERAAQSRLVRFIARFIQPMPVGQRLPSNSRRTKTTGANDGLSAGAVDVPRVAGTAPAPSGDA